MYQCHIQKRRLPPPLLSFTFQRSATEKADFSQKSDFFRSLIGNLFRMKKKISILGSTGSIGRQALEVVENSPEKFEIYGIAAGKNIEILKEQINKFHPEIVSVQNEEIANELAKFVKDIPILYGDEGLIEIAQNKKNSLVLIAVTGLVGLYPTLAAIDNNIDVALANKETLVSAGNIVMERARKNHVKILPVDSEHSAIHQCLQSSSDLSQVRKLILTGSGGPFQNKICI